MGEETTAAIFFWGDMKANANGAFSNFIMFNLSVHCCKLVCEFMQVGRVRTG